MGDVEPHRAYIISWIRVKVEDDCAFEFIKTWAVEASDVLKLNPNTLIHLL